MYTYKSSSIRCQEAVIESTPGIYYDSLTRTFRLRCKNSVYAFRVDDSRNLEHLYWGSSIPLEDDLLFLGFGNNPTPFDPKGYIGDSWESLNPLGFADLKQLDPDEVAEKWKTYTVEAQTPRATEPRRLENASWRLWNMDKLKRTGSTLSGVDKHGSVTLEENYPSTKAVFDDSHRKGLSSLEVVYDDEPWSGGDRSEVSSPSYFRTDSVDTGHSSSEKEEESSDTSVKRRFLSHKTLPTWKRSPSLRRGEGFEKNLPSIDSLEDEFLSCSRFGSFSSPTPRQQQQNVWINLDPEIVGKNTKLLEYSDRGTGDYRSCSFEIEYSDGTTLSPLVYSSHRIFGGKLLPPYPLPGLYVNVDSDATTLELTMIDPLTKVAVILYYTVFHEYDAIVRRTVFRNHLDESLIIRRCFSCTQDFDTDDFYLTQLSGSWARERQLVTKKLYQGMSLVESTRGASSHQHNPFGVITLGTPREDQGEAFAFSLVYSGNFRLESELVESGRLRVNMGINPQQFSWDLGPAEEFSTPEVVLCYSDQGLGGISQQFHRLYRYHLIPPMWRHTICPVLINTWEAMYFNVTHEAVVELAKRAKECGIELVVLDDGWFGNRNNTRSGLGDWKANRTKFPFGLEGLCREINELGLRFGIWIEPEMVNIESELYHQHPDWCLHIPRRARTTGRNQLVLDFSQEAVRNHVIEEVSSILSSCNIEYVKWDMNRHLTEVFSQAFPPERQGEIAHRHILGVYEAFARITGAFPQVLIESCSGGGGRFDPGMLYYSAQIWCSDNTDALSRVQIQYGTSLVYPVCSMGSHVSSIPNHQTLRSTTMKTRSLVAMCGTFGYEMDVRQLSRDEVEEIRSYIELRNEFAPLVLFGTMYRLWNPFTSDSGGWMFVNDEKTEALVIAVNLNRPIGLQLPRMHLRGIREDWEYLVEELCPGKLRTNVSTGAIETDPRGVFQWSTNLGGVTLKLSGRTLMKVGLPVKFIFEGDSLLFSVRAVSLLT
ncbi:alpha-galactosidase [Galdieria sulphuraria]|uniref:alpha-galactosidase n=1 Tax=Galdieria sulphuraria TaxID=130081 RepID=M2XZW9_GALSU|nr:alpha-galactosidase [Galdieria sulphuraria]EME29178.1 alpha-galactosidase [Galdieria sulphuraria]|eukprot:XP_005705698.1 alpha-galactosidase [Galdieria sulphuraria]